LLALWCEGKQTPEPVNDETNVETFAFFAAPRLAANVDKAAFVKARMKFTTRYFASRAHLARNFTLSASKATKDDPGHFVLLIQIAIAQPVQSSARLIAVAIPTPTGTARHQKPISV
jgi:hypothetical protein